MLPVEYTVEQKRVVRTFESGQSHDPDFWSDDSVHALRVHIKTHYLNQQNQTCCYCRKRVDSVHGRVWDVEHIVSRMEAAKFMFTPKNLAVACPDCNIAKSEIQVVLGAEARRYPRSASRFTIVHPHFDVFNENILIIAGRYYLGLTRKGTTTITVCKLYRFVNNEDLSMFVENPGLREAVDAAFDSNSRDAFMGIVRELQASID